LRAAQFSGIGAFSRATVSYFDWERKEYRGNPVNEQVEVASLIGDVAIAPTAVGRFMPISCWAGETAALWQGTWPRDMYGQPWSSF
jgi:hypothetical protein